MLCGLTRIRSKIKRLSNQFYLWRWRNKYEFFYCKHCCIGCEFFDTCMKEFMDIVDHTYEYSIGEGYYQEWCDTVYGETDEMLLWHKECQENEFTEALLDDLEHTNYK